MESKEQKTSWNLQNGKKILPYVLLFSGIFLTLSLGSFDAGEEGIRHNFFGRLGFYLSYGMFFLFGAASFLPGLFAIGLGSLRLVKDEFELTNRLFSLPVFLFCFTVTLQVTGHVSTVPFASQGGFTGQLLSAGLEFIFGSTGKILIHLVFYFYGLILLLNESPLHFLGRMIGLAGARYKEGFQSGFSKRGEGLGSLFQSAVERFQKRESDPPWFSARSAGSHSPEAIFEQMVASKRNHGKREPSELQNALQNAFGKEGRLSDLLSKTDSRPMVRSESDDLSSVRFQNQGAFRGNFEEQGRVFRFESVSSSLAEKIKEEKKFQETTSRWEILDFRTARSENHFRKETYPSSSLETEEEENEFNFSNEDSVKPAHPLAFTGDALDETEFSRNEEMGSETSEEEDEAES
ncbi:DNA translocase FtsK 4TM domain-containing protein, partial [Leptospira ellisii]